MRLTLDEFRKEHQRIIRLSFPKERLEDFIYNNLENLPHFYENTRVRKIGYASKIPQIADLYERHQISRNIYLLKHGDVFYKDIMRTDLKEFFIPPEVCIGTTWLFENDFSNLREHTLAQLLSCPPGKISDIPPLFAIKASDNYLCTDGNHRIYASYLLGYMVKVHCYQEYQSI